MSKENLLRLIDRLPADKLGELESLVISMLPAEQDFTQAREPRLEFEQALDLANRTIGKTLKRLSQ